MRIIISAFILSFAIYFSPLYAQQENVELSNPVYEFLKDMNVKGVFGGYDDAMPNLSRAEIGDFLKTIDAVKLQLSKTEKSLLEKYKIEFLKEYQTSENTFVLFDMNGSFGNKVSNLLSQKQKYIFKGDDGSNNVYINFLGNVYLSKGIKPDSKRNAEIMDGGFRVHGTLFQHLGYYFSLNKGMIVGQKDIAALAYPKLSQDYKFNENLEKVLNYDFSNAYLRYYISPMDNMGLSVQFGREQITMGYGYGSKLELSGDSPDMDFLKIRFKYGVLRYDFIHASTVGNFSYDYSKRITKYFAANRFGVSIKNLFDADINETVVYSGRLEFAYLNPLGFYQFVEKSIQDRDNKNFAIEIQTHFWKNVQFQGTYFVDDDEGFASLLGKTDHHQKFGYQIGTYIYQPLSIPDLSFVLEYTKIRPYTYSHITPEETYSAYGVGLGHRIGPNADEVYSRLSYNTGDWGRFNLEYQFIRKGNNIYDAQGNMIKNVGGDMEFPFIDNIDDPNATFLDGERVNTDAFHLSFRYQPIKNFYFTLKYVYQINFNLTKNTKSDQSFAFLWMTIDY